MSSTQITCELDRCIKNLLAWHDEPNKPTKGKDPFHICSWSPHLSPFQSRHGPPHSILSGCIYEKTNPGAGNPEERIPSKKTGWKATDGWLGYTLTGRVVAGGSRCLLRPSSGSVVGSRQSLSPHNPQQSYIWLTKSIKETKRTGRHCS